MNDIPSLDAVNGADDHEVVVVADTPSASPPPPDKPVSLRTRAVRSTAWILAGYVGQRGLRLVSNLVLTRMLFPEAFGLMAYVQVVMAGLEAFSDLGTSASVIKDPRGAEPRFLNTAWTLQLIRSAALWLVACGLAWPTAAFYDQPELLYLVPVCALSSLLGGLTSPSVILLKREADVGPLVLRDLVSGVAGALATIGVAAIWPSAWALVVGTLVDAALHVVLSYTWLPGPRPQFAWEPAVVRDIVRFGRWVFLATAITFLLQQGDRMVLGKFMSAADLGIYSIAALISRVLMDALLKVNGQVLFPIFARIHHLQPDELPRKVRKSRIVLLAACLPPMWALGVFGEQIVGWLYDDRYQAAGWILRVLACGATAGVITLSAGVNVLLVHGDSFRALLLQIWRGVALIGSMWIGSRVGGRDGLIIGVAASKALDYPCLAWATAKYGVWQPDIDLAAFGVSAVIFAAGWMFV